MLSAESEIYPGEEKIYLSEVEKKAVRFLSSLYECQTAFHNNDLDGDRKKDYACSIGELMEAMGDRKEDLEHAYNQIAAYKVEIVAVDGEAHWSANADPDPEKMSHASQQGRYVLRHFYIDENGLVRFEEGSPASIESKQYKE